jgi:uncharacterized protein YbaP (TraB family)
LILPLAGVMMVAGCSAPEPMVTGPVHPAMWQVSDGDTRIILLGSVHLLPPDLDWQDDRIRRAVAQSDELLLELAPSEVDQVPALFAATSHDEPVPPLATRVGRAAADQLIDALKASGMAEDDAETTESWALTLLFSNIATADLGLSADNGVEAVLTRTFASAGKRVGGLETAHQQLTLFDDLPDTAQNAMLASSVNRAAQAPVTIRTTIRAWAAGDVATIERMASEDFARTPALAEPLVHARNRRWADQLAARMQRPGTILVAVGTGHLVGDGALPALLAARGFTVQRLPNRPSRR